MIASEATNNQMANLVVATPRSGLVGCSTACSTGSVSSVLGKRKLLGFLQLINPNRQLCVSIGGVQHIDRVDVDIGFPEHSREITKRSRPVCHGDRQHLPLLKIGMDLLELGTGGVYVARDQLDHALSRANHAGQRTDVDLGFPESFGEECQGAGPVFQPDRKFGSDCRPPNLSVRSV